MSTEQDRTEPRKIELVPLNDVSTELQLKIRDIRNEVGIRKWMYTDHAIDLNEHLGWLSRVKKDEKQIVFVVLDEQGII